jgi:hypothetical protein
VGRAEPKVGPRCRAAAGEKRRRRYAEQQEPETEGKEHAQEGARGVVNSRAQARMPVMVRELHQRRRDATVVVFSSCADR